MCGHADSFDMCCCVQVLWWGMDETVAELFARHLLASGFDRNPPDKFIAGIGGSEYGPDETPALIGLYGAWYTVVIHACECKQGAQCCLFG